MERGNLPGNLPVKIIFDLESTLEPKTSAVISDLATWAWLRKEMWLWSNLSDHDLNYLTSLKSIKAQMNRQRGLLSHWHETTLMVWLSMYNFPPQIVPIFPLFYSCIVRDTNTGTTVGDWEQKVLRKERNLSAFQKFRIRNSDNLNLSSSLYQSLSILCCAEQEQLSDLAWQQPAILQHLSFVYSILVVIMNHMVWCTHVSVSVSTYSFKFNYNLFSMLHKDTTTMYWADARWKFC